jgi:alkylation response protein AidB-like acyl-CoA dehydrogenase
LLGLTIDSRCGGGGPETLGALLVIEEAARVSGAIGFAVTLFLSYGGQIFGPLGSERQRERFLPRIARGECVVALALTEPGAGSDLASIRATATLDGRELTLRSEKTVITSADVADVLIVLARSDAAASRASGFSFVVVDAKQPGDEALAYANEYQSISHLLAELDAEIHAAQLVLWHAASLHDAGRPCGREGAIAKVLASEAAKKTALGCLQIHGGSGYTMALDVQRYVRDALLLTIGGGTTQIQRNVIARHLGLRAR